MTPDQIKLAILQAFARPSGSVSVLAPQEILDSIITRYPGLTDQERDRIATSIREMNVSGYILYDDGYQLYKTNAGGDLQRRLQVNTVMPPRPAPAASTAAGQAKALQELAHAAGTSPAALALGDE